MYREILVPTDGSKAAERAIHHALDLAETYGARIHALYVVDTSFSTSRSSRRGRASPTRLTAKVRWRWTRWNVLLPTT